MNISQLSKLLALRQARVNRANLSVSEQLDKTRRLKERLKDLDKEAAALQNTRRQHQAWWENRLKTSALSGQEIAKIQQTISADNLLTKKIGYKREKIQYKIMRETARYNQLASGLNKKKRQLKSIEELIKRQKRKTIQHRDIKEEEVLEQISKPQHASPQP